MGLIAYLQSPWLSRSQIQLNYTGKNMFCCSFSQLQQISSTPRKRVIEINLVSKGKPQRHHRLGYQAESAFLYQ